MLIEGISIFIVTVIIALVVAWLVKDKKEEVRVQQNPLGRMRLGQQIGADDGEEEKVDAKNEAKTLGRKEAAKLEKKEKKRNENAARRAAIEEHNKIQEEKYEQRRKKDEEAEQKENEEEERLQKIEEEKRKKEEEEYAEWKNLLAVESVGEEIQEEVFTLDKFLEYIKLRKVVMIEDLANAFNLDGKAVVNRIHELENAGYLGGILDDRGKYIYITQEEFLAFKKYVEARGRVTRIELCSEGNRLIRLNPTPEDKAKIDAEDKLNIEKE